MPVVGRITAKFDADTKDLDASLKGIEGAVNGTSATVTAGFSKMEGSLAKSTRAIQQSGKATKEAIDQLVLKDKLEAGAKAFATIAGAVDGFRQELNRAGGDADDLRDRLSATFGDLADEKAKFAEDQLKLGFDPDSTANALIELKKFGVESTDAFKRLQDAARFTNTDIVSLAGSFGQFEKFATPKSLLALQKQLGVSSTELEKFGAKLDENGKPLLDTEARLNAASAALRAYMDVNFTGAAERQADAATRVAGELEALKREVGLNVTAFKESFAPAILDVVQGLRGMSDGTKAAIGLGVEFVGQAASMAASAFTLGSQLVIMSGNARLAAIGLRACNAATAAFSATLDVALGPLGLVALAVTGLALAVAQYNDDLAEAADNEVVLASAQDKGIIRYERNKDLIGKNADELRKMGKTAKDVGILVDGLNAKQAEARAANDGAGDKDAEARYNAQAVAANKVRSELEKIEAAEDKRKKPAGAGGSASDLSKKEQEKLNRQKEAEQKRADAIEEKARKEALDSQLDLVKQQAAAGDITKAQQIEGLRDVLNNARVTAGERRTIEIQIAQLQGQIRKEQTAEDARENAKRTAEAKAEAAKRGRETAKAEADAKRAAAKDASQEKADLGKIEALAKTKAEAEKQAIDKQIGSLDSAKDKAQIEKLLNAKLAITEAEINAERDAIIKGTKNEEVKVAAVQAAEAKIKAARADNTAALKAETDKQKQAMKELGQQATDTAQEIVQASITSQVGGANSPIFSDVSQGLGINLGSFGLGDLKKQPSATLKPATNTINATQTPNSTPPLIDPKQASTNTADQIAAALKAAPLSITVQTVVDGKKQEKTFSGTSAELAAGLNTFNADFSLGTP